MKWTVEFLNPKVEEEFGQLPKDMQARFVRIAELLEQYGLEHVGMPHVRHIQDKLWEMRAKGKAGITEAARTLISSLSTTAPLRDREIEKAKAMAEARKRFGGK